MPDYKYRGPTRLYLDYTCSTGAVYVRDGDVVSGLSAVRDVPVPPDDCWTEVTFVDVPDQPAHVVEVDVPAEPDQAESPADRTEEK